MRRTLEEIRRSDGPIGNFVSQRHKELGYTQAKLAERGWVGQRYLKELELGKKALRLDKVSEVVELLGGQITI